MVTGLSRGSGHWAGGREEVAKVTCRFLVRVCGWIKDNGGRRLDLGGNIMALISNHEKLEVPLSDVRYGEGI